MRRPCKAGCAQVDSRAFLFVNNPFRESGHNLNMKEYCIVGIDFGTSSTVVAVKNYPTTTETAINFVLSAVDGTKIIPTMIFQRASDHKYYYGLEVEKEARDSDGRMFINFKMDLVSEDVSKKDLARRLTKQFFKYLYNLFDEQRSNLGITDETTIRTIVSYPAKWPSEVISFMKAAASEAGFGDIQSINGENEPSAAIRSALVASPKTVQKTISYGKAFTALLLDMGAGTSDVTIAKCIINDKQSSNPGIQVGFKGAKGNNQITSYPPINNPFLCGGREIDDALIKWAERTVEEGFSKGSNRNERQFLRHKTKATNAVDMKKWKETNLSRALSSDKQSEYGALRDALDTFDAPASCLPALNKKTFEDITANHWKNLSMLIEEAVQFAPGQIDDFKGAQDIDVVFLTGGHSQWYKVKEFFIGENSMFAKVKENHERLIIQGSPQSAVAAGLAYRGIENFDLKQSSTNGVWIDVSFACKKFSFNPVEQFANLPKRVACKTDYVSVMYNNDTDYKVPVKCDIYYGGNREEAKHYERKVYIPLNNILSRWMAIGKNFIKKVIGQEDREVSKFSLRVYFTVHMSEDGTGKIQGYGVSDNDRSDEFEIDL